MKLSLTGKFTVLLFLLFLLLPCLGMAQISDPGCDPTDPFCPIDGGLSLLIAAGIGLGAKKAYQERKKLTALKD